MTNRLHLEVIRTSKSNGCTPVNSVRVYNGDVYLGELPCTSVSSKASSLDKELFLIEMDGHFVRTRILDTPYPDDPRVETDEIVITS